MYVHVRPRPSNRNCNPHSLACGQPCKVGQRSVGVFRRGPSVRPSVCPSSNPAVAVAVIRLRSGCDPATQHCVMEDGSSSGPVQTPASLSVRRRWRGGKHLNRHSCGRVYRAGGGGGGGVGGGPGTDSQTTIDLQGIN